MDAKIKGKRLAEKILIYSALLLLFFIGLVVESSAQSFSTIKAESVQCDQSQELIASKLPWNAIITAGCEDRKNKNSAHITCDAVDIRLIGEMFSSSGRVTNQTNLDLFNAWAKDRSFKDFLKEYQIEEFFIEVPYQKTSRKGYKIYKRLKAELNIAFWVHIKFNPDATGLHLHIGRWAPIEDKLLTMVVTEDEAKELKILKPSNTMSEYEFENSAALGKDEFLPEIKPIKKVENIDGSEVVVDWNRGSVDEDVVDILDIPIDKPEEGEKTTIENSTGLVNWDTGLLETNTGRAIFPVDDIEKHRDTTLTAVFEDAVATVDIKWKAKKRPEKINDKEIGLWTVLLKWRKDAQIDEGILDPEDHKAARNELVRLFTLVYSKDRHHLPRHKVLALAALSTQMHGADKLKAISDFFIYAPEENMLRLFDEHCRFKPGFLKQVYKDPTRIEMGQIRAQLFSNLTHIK